MWRLLTVNTRLFGIVATSLNRVPVRGLVDSTLSFYQVRVVVGHDIINSVSSFYQGKVIGIDVNEHEGNSQGLLIENNTYFKIDLIGKNTLFHRRQKPFVDTAFRPKHILLN